MLTYWKDSLSKIQKIDLKINKTVKRKTVMYVFQTMFLQMALHIFVDSATAKDILNVSLLVKVGRALIFIGEFISLAQFSHHFHG